MKIVIIEDEQYTAEDLASCIKELRKNYEIVKILSSVKDAKSFFTQNTDYNLIFSDIHLGDGLSFEIFKDINVKAPVIFCTAFDNYAIEAFKANGIDYILKPFDKKNIQQAIEKFEMLASSNSQTVPDMLELVEIFHDKLGNKATRSYLVHHKDKIIPVKTDDIAIFFIRNEGTSILDFKGQVYAISDSLEDIEKHVSGDFIRANRQYIVNRKAVKDLTQHFARKLVINLSIPFSEQIIISKERAPFFLKWLENS